MYGVERVGLASGLKSFGTTNWYTEGAKFIMQKQHPDGSWSRRRGDAGDGDGVCVVISGAGAEPGGVQQAAIQRAVECAAAGQRTSRRRGSARTLPEQSDELAGGEHEGGCGGVAGLADFADHGIQGA